MKLKTPILLLAAFSFIFLTGFGRSGCGDNSPEGKMKRVNRMATAAVEDFMDDLDADDTQIARVQTIKDRVLKELPSQMAEHKKAKVALVDQWKSAKPDSERVHQIINSRVDSVRYVIHIVADGLIELHQILTPEQRAEVNEHLDRH